MYYHMMTRPSKRIATQKSAAKPLAAFGPVPGRRSLTHELASRLTADIISGRLAPGTQLPTEQELIQATGVSRTVIREAVAALRADGLVMTRQGVGAFVAPNTRRPFRIDVDELQSREVVDVMELRTGVEIEAAGLAAERATAADRRRITAAYAKIDAAIGRNDDAIAEDFAFHSAIAAAAGNPQFDKFLQYLGRFIIPRQSIRSKAGSPSDRRAYLETIQKEHGEIRDAIFDGAVTQARGAMRRHLVNSRKRYQKMVASLGEV